MTPPLHIPAHTREPATEHILKRLLRNDKEGAPGWALNAELRRVFGAMLQVEQQKHGRGL